MSKYVRYQPAISRHSESNLDEDNWLNKIQKGLEKDAVQPKSVDNSLFHQINSIMNGRSKYPSVAAAVEDMKERSGLTAYLSKISEDDSSNKKVASNGQDAPAIQENPTVIQKVPSIKNTLDNYIRDTKGNIPVPAIIDYLKSIHRNDVVDVKDWEDDRLIRLVSQKNLEAKSTNPDNMHQHNNLGVRDNSADIDPSNTDAFYALNPAKI